MEVKIKPDYSQVWYLIKQLSDNQIIKLREELEKEFFNRVIQIRIEKSTIEKLVLSAPIMTDEQYLAFRKQRKHFNQWRRQKKQRKQFA